MNILARHTLDIPASLDNKSLKQQLGQHLSRLPRRVDRLTWQCLLAAAPLKPHLQSACGIYLASHYPSRDTMNSLLNSVRNAAGCYLAQLLELEGPNLCLGSHEQIWPQLMQLAHSDLSAGLISQALLINCVEDAAGNATLDVLLASNHPSQRAE